MSDCCRICLETGASVSLYHSESSSVLNKPSEMYNKFIICTSLQVSDNDSMPKALCEECSMRLDDAYRLREQAQKSDSDLKQRLGLIKIEHSNPNIWYNVNLNKKGTLEENNIEKKDCNNKLYGNNKQIWVHEKKENLEEFDYEDETDNQSYETEFTKNERGNNFEDVKLSVKTNDVHIKLDPFLRETIEKVSKSRIDTSLMAGSIKITKISKNIPKKPPKIVNKSKSKIRACGKYSVSIPIIYEDLSMSNFEPEWKNLKTKQKTEPKKYECKMCSVVFSTSRLCKTHRRVDHPKIKRVYEKKYMCDICGKTFDGRYGLETHTRVHTGERPYVCKYCSKAFVRQSHMDIHIAARHLKLKPYQCELCSSRFAASSSFREHVRSHDALRRYACAHCDKTFSKRFSFTRHQLTHTKERPYSCKVCNSSYMQSNDLKAHVKRVHVGIPTDKLSDYCVKQIINPHKQPPPIFDHP